MRAGALPFDIWRIPMFQSEITRALALLNTIANELAANGRVNQADVVQTAYVVIHNEYLDLLGE